MDRYETNAELERLCRVLQDTEAAVAGWRELLIESLGDRMCGCGRGPTSDDLAVLAALQAAEQHARDVHAMWLMSIFMRQDGQDPGGSRHSA